MSRTTKSANRGSAATPTPAAKRTKPAQKKAGRNTQTSKQIVTLAAPAQITNLTIDQITANSLRVTFTPAPANVPSVAVIADNFDNPNDPTQQFAGIKTSGSTQVSPYVFTINGLSASTLYTIHVFASDGQNLALGHSSKTVSTTP
jgi:hypothetical protein